MSVKSTLSTGRELEEIINFSSCDISLNLKQQTLLQASTLNNSVCDNAEQLASELKELSTEILCNAQMKAHTQKRTHVKRFKY